MPVIQLLLHLPSRVHIEIVKPRLPERSQRFSSLVERQSQLRRVAGPSQSAQLPRHAQLQFLEYRRRRPLLRFTDQQMHMLWHHHITDQVKSHLMANLPQFFRENVPGQRSFQKWPPPVTTEGNKVKMTLAIVAFEPRRHRETPRKETATPRPRYQKPEPGAPSVSLHLPGNC